MTYEDLDKSWLGDAAKRAKAAAKAKRQQIKSAKYQDHDYANGPRQDVVPANFNKRPNWKGPAVGAGLVGTAAAGGYMIGNQPPKPPQQLQEPAAVKKAYYTEEEIAKFAVMASLKNLGNTVKTGAKKHKAALSANPRAYGQAVGTKVGGAAGRAYGRAKNYFAPGGKPNYKRIGGWGAAGAGTLGAGYMIGKAETMPADEYSARRRDTTLGLGSNALGATVGAVATGQAGYVAHQHFKNKKEKAGKPPSHALEVYKKPPSKAAKMKAVLGSKKATAVLVPAALVANIPFQAGNAAADANSAKFFAQERGRLKDIEPVKKDDEARKYHEFQQKQSRDKYLKYRANEREAQIKSNLSALGAVAGTGGLGWASGNAKSMLARQALGYGAAFTGAGGLLSMAHHGKTARRNAHSKHIQGGSHEEHTMALEHMKKNDEGLATCYEGPARGTGMGTNLNLPPETVSKEQRIFHGWDPDAQRKKNNRRKAGTAVAATSGAGSALLGASAISDVRAADKEVGETRRQKKDYSRPANTAQRPGYVDDDWGRKKSGERYGRRDGTSGVADFSQEIGRSKGEDPAKPTNRERRDRVRADQRKDINDRAFNAGQNAQKKKSENPLKSTRTNLKDLAGKLGDKKRFKAKAGGALGLATLAGVSYKVSRDD